jgi:hypothetical protein
MLVLRSSCEVEAVDCVAAGAAAVEEDEVEAAGVLVAVVAAGDVVAAGAEVETVAASVGVISSAFATPVKPKVVRAAVVVIRAIVFLLK